MNADKNPFSFLTPFFQKDDADFLVSIQGAQQRQVALKKLINSRNYVFGISVVSGLLLILLFLFFPSSSSNISVIVLMAFQSVALLNIDMKIKLLLLDEKLSSPPTP